MYWAFIVGTRTSPTMFPRSSPWKRGCPGHADSSQAPRLRGKQRARDVLEIMHNTSRRYFPYAIRAARYRALTLPSYESNMFFSKIRCITRCVLQTSKEFWVFFVPSIILVVLFGNTCLLARVQKVMICDWWISIRFICFLLQGSLLCDSPVSGNNRLVKFASQIFLIFLILATCKNKATSVSLPRQKIHSPS